MENNQKSFPPYESAHFRARMTIIFLALNIVLDLIALGSGFMEIGLLSSAQEGARSLMPKQKQTIFDKR